MNIPHREPFGASEEPNSEGLFEEVARVYRQDSLIIALVCDAKGAQHDGKSVAFAATEAMERALRVHPVPASTEAVEAALREANRTLIEMASKQVAAVWSISAMALVVDKQQAYLAHVGDLRLARKRNGSFDVLTREHTMQNLFVETELLSQSDAETHPEAHVLARALGNQHAVEIELSEYKTLLGDIWMILGDGVYRTLSDEHIAHGRWESPLRAAEDLLRQARLHEPARAMVAVGIFIGMEQQTSEEADPTVALPFPLPKEEPSTQTPAPEATPHEGLVETALKNTKDDFTSWFQWLFKVKKKPTKTEKEPIPKLLILSGVLTGLTVAVLGALLLLEGTKETEKFVEQASKPLGTSALPTTPKVVVAPLFSPPPAAPVRPPHVPTRYGGTPPMTPEQHSVVSATREGRCADGLENISKALKKSEDFAPLYHSVWICFNETQQQRLLDPNLQTLEQLLASEAFFSGNIESLCTHCPAKDGIEARLVAWVQNKNKPSFSEVIRARIGDPTAADMLFNDLWLEASAAAKLASSSPATPQITETLARRVFVVESALSGPIGEFIKTHRSDDLAALNELRKQALKAPSPAVRAAAEKAKAEPLKPLPDSPENTQNNDNASTPPK